MTNLSPAAQAVLDAYKNSLTTKAYTTSGRIAVAVAAALRAVADQVVPNEVAERKMFPWQQERLVQRLITWEHIFTIAAELEQLDD